MISSLLGYYDGILSKYIHTAQMTSSPSVRLSGAFVMSIRDYFYINSMEQHNVLMYYDIPTMHTS